MFLGHALVHFVSFSLLFAFVSPFLHFICFLLHSFLNKFFIPSLFSFLYLLFGGYFVTFSLLFTLLLNWVCSRWGVASFKAPQIKIQVPLLVYLFWFSFFTHFNWFMLVGCSLFCLHLCSIGLVSFVFLINMIQFFSGFWGISLVVDDIYYTCILHILFSF